MLQLKWSQWKRLYNYGIRLQIDLRSDFEIEQQPSSLIGYKDIEYIRIDLMKTNKHKIKTCCKTTVN